MRAACAELWRRRDAWAPWLAAAGLLAAALVLPLQAPFNHDEEQYVAAAVLARTLRPVLDFGYLQTPLQPWVEAPLLALVPGWPFAAARLASAGFTLGALACAYALVRRADARPAFAALAVAWIASSGLVRVLMLTARNDALPAMLALLGLLALLEAGRRERRVVRLAWAAGAGLALSLAVSAKLTYVFAPAVGGLWLVWEAARRRAGPGELAAFALGSLAGLAPTLAVIAAAPEAARFDLFGFHHDVTPLWYARNALGERRGPVFHALFWLVVPGRDIGVVSGGLLALGLGARAALRRRRGEAAEAAPPVWPLAGLAAAVALVAAAAPNPSFPAYAAPPALLLLLAVAGRCAALREARERRVVAALMALAGAVGWAGALARVAQPPSAWTVSRVHAAATAVAAGEAGAGVRRPVATLSPIRALDAGLPIYPELAPGPFVFRSGADAPARAAAAARAATPATLEALLRARPPGAVVTGYEADGWRIDADAPLIAWARARGWRAQALPDGGRLWLPRAR